jgi:hypothetical protein
MPKRTKLLRSGWGKRPLRLRRQNVSLAFVLGAMFVVVPTAAGTGALDTTPPSISYTIDGITGSNGWYRGSTHGNFVVVQWTVTDPDSAVTSTTGCEAAIRIDSPNTGTTRTCSATSDGGTTSVTTKTIKVDAEPPTGVAAAARRAPDYAGWYNHPVEVDWTGSDVTSGIASCTSLTFPGPGLTAASLAGGCTDNAGNSSSSVFALQYDATPPTLTDVSVQSNAGADVLRWKSSSPSDVAVVKRVARDSRKVRLVFDGAKATFVDTTIRANVEYRYHVQTFDQAGNASSEVSILALPKVVTLKKLAYVPRAARNPILRWLRTRGAAYYHVQLFQDGKRILAAWPLSTELRLRAAWRWNGRRHRLSAGTYSWYAWAGFGSRSAVRYKRLGSATFIVP